MKIVFLLISLIGSMALAEDSWRTHAVAASSNPSYQNQIDETTAEIFNSSLKKDLCEIFPNLESLQLSLGLSAKQALAIHQSCPPLPVKNLSSQPTKNLPKIYYLSNEDVEGLESWTDFSNRTYIFSAGRISREELKSILLHEITIAADAKVNLLPTIYVKFKTDLGQKASVSAQLHSAFLRSLWTPVSRTFATLRAFNFERLAAGNQSLSGSAESCRQEFLKLFDILKGISDLKDGEAAPSDIAGIINKYINGAAENLSRIQSPRSPEEEKQILEMILSADLQIEDFNQKKVSFCQFMARPYLTNLSLFSFYANGPRPRVTGGAGGQGSSNIKGTFDLPPSIRSLEGDLEKPFPSKTKPE